MAARAICMMCRPTVTMTCVRCGNEGPGFHDGHLWCLPCRSSQYFKAWLYADTTGGRLWRVITAGLEPDWQPRRNPE